VETKALILTLYHKTKRKLNQEIGTTRTVAKICGLAGMRVGPQREEMGSCRI